LHCVFGYGNGYVRKKSFLGGFKGVCDVFIIAKLQNQVFVFTVSNYDGPDLSHDII
jgi:hypothetical protein